MLPTMSGKLPRVPEQKFALGATYHRTNRLANLHPTKPYSIQYLTFKQILHRAPKTKADHPAGNKIFLTAVFLKSKGEKRYF